MENKKIAPIKKDNINRFLISKVYQKRLVDSNRFICYKADKTPYNAETKKLAKVTDKADYRSFDFALNSARINPNFKGIGFVLGNDITNDFNYCGLDIDDCINDKGEISKEAIEIIDLLDTYTEISMNNRGIHCIFIAKKQGEICKNYDLDFCKCLELYDNSRYFALTGNVIVNKDIEYRQEQCNTIYDKYFKCKELPEVQTAISDNQEIRNFENKKYGNDYLKYIFEKDEKFKNLWYRKIIIKDESATDQAFFNKLCYWLDEKTDLMEEWFYKSPYFKGKDEKHNKKALRPDYIKRTIAKALEYYKRGKENV